MRILKVEAQGSVYQRPAVIAGLALLCCALWGSAFPCIKIGYGLLNIEGAGSQILFGGYRFMLAGLITLAFACVKKRSIVRVERSLIPYLIAQGLIQTAVQYILYYIGVAHTTGSKGAVINASNTFFSIFFAHFLMKDEKITLRKLLGCIVGFTGILIMNMGADPNGGSITLLGEGFVLLSSLAYGKLRNAQASLAQRGHHRYNRNSVYLRQRCHDNPWAYDGRARCRLYAVLGAAAFIPCAALFIGVYHLRIAA